MELDILLVGVRKGAIRSEEDFKSLEGAIEKAGLVEDARSIIYIDSKHEGNDPKFELVKLKSVDMSWDELVDKLKVELRG